MSTTDTAARPRRVPKPRPAAKPAAKSHSAITTTPKPKAPVKATVDSKSIQKPAAAAAAVPMATPKVRRTQAQRREETRTRILDAAASELHGKGYAGFRINEVAKLAKVSKGAQTHHFPTKESLIIAALQRAYEAAQQRSMALVESVAAGGDVLDALMRDSERFYLGPTFVASVTMLGAGREPEMQRHVQLISRTYRLPVEESWLEALKRSGIPDETARTVLYLTQSVFRGLVMRRFMRDDPEYIEFSLAKWRELARAQIEIHRKSTRRG